MRLGFTLLEVLAVLMIGALLMSFMVPNLSALNARALSDQADALVAKIDLARQRAVVTGVTHRLVVNLDEGAYALEWQGADPDTAQPDALDSFDPGSGDELSLAAPPGASRDFVPLPGLMGHVEYLGSDIEFSGIDAPGGWANFGDADVRFERDGSASYATLVLNEPDGRELSLEILPLADQVRILDASD
jgi:prepilin-type N-terminal cleavage/methylation domain-containing protein